MAIVIVKQLFGGIGMNFANPALVGRIVLFISFAGSMNKLSLIHIFPPYRDVGHPAGFQHVRGVRLLRRALHAGGRVGLSLIHI